MKKNVLILPGDGIGPEVVAEAVRLMEAAAPRAGFELQLDQALLGGRAIDRTLTAKKRCR